MAEPLFDAGLEVFTLAIMALVYIAIFINLLTKRGTDQVYFLFVLAGYLFITTVIKDFFLATTFIAMWFVAAGVEIFVSKWVLIGLFAVMAFLGYSNPFFFLLALALYAITTANFIFSSFRLLKSKA